MIPQQVEYHDLSGAAEREVFQRVQLGVSLTTAEKLQAIASPWADYITHLEKTHVTIDGGLVDQIAFDDTRGRAFQNVAQLVYCCSGLPAAQRVPTAAKLDKWLNAPEERPPTAAFQDSMGAVLGRLWELARSSELDAPFRKFKAKISPVEFVFIGTCVCVCCEAQPSGTFFFWWWSLLSMFVGCRRIVICYAPWLHSPRTISRCVHPPPQYPQGAHRRTFQHSRRR